MGPEQHLRRKCPEEPGGCLNGPSSLRISKLGYMGHDRKFAQSIIFLSSLRNSHEVCRGMPTGRRPLSGSIWAGRFAASLSRQNRCETAWGGLEAREVIRV